MHSPISKSPTRIFYPMAGDSLGGSHHSLLGLLNGLDKQKFRPVIVLEKPDGRLAQHFSQFEQMADPAPPKDSFAVGRKFGVGKFMSTLSGVNARARFLRANGAAIVHSNDGRTHATWALAAKAAGCKLLWHHRADPTARGLRYLAPWVADQIVTVSRFSLPRNQKTTVARSAKVVFSPFDVNIEVDRSAMRQALLDELGANQDTLICGFFGSYIDRKRPLMFIEAIARLRAIQSRPVKGVMFGETTYPELESAMRERIAADDVSGAVHMMGYRSPGAHWIAACDYLLVPAIDEPLGRTLVEAMLVETPVIATNSGGNPEAILDGLGVLVSPDDPVAMAQACATMATDTVGVQAQSMRAKASATERFSQKAHVAAISSIYCELAEIQ